MKQYKLLALTLGGALMLGGLAPTYASADSAADIADLKRMVMEMQKAHDAELNTLKQQINNLQKPAQIVDSQGVNITELKQQVEELQDAQISNEETLMSRIQIHGSLSQGYLKSDNNNWLGETDDGHWNFNEFTLNVSADLTDKLRAGVQFMSRDMGPMVNNELRLDWAVMDYAWKDELGLRAGLLKVPMGMYNESRDIDGARTGVFLPQGFYGEGVREIFSGVKGVGVYGNLDMGRAGSLGYLGVFGDQDLDKEGEIVNTATGIGAIDEGSASKITTDHVAALSLNYDTPLDGWRLNTTYYRANIHLDADKTFPDPYDPKPPLAGTTQAVTLDINYMYNWTVGTEYTWNDLILAGEFRRTYKPQELYIAGNLAKTTTLTAEGWYLSGTYQFCEWFTGQLSYSEFYPDKDDKGGDRFTDTVGDEEFYAWDKIWSVNGRFDINDYWLFKMGIDFHDGMGTGLNFQNPDGAEEDWILYQFKTTVNF